MKYMSNTNSSDLSLLGKYYLKQTKPVHDILNHKEKKIYRKKEVGKKSLTHSNKRGVGTDLLQLSRVTQPGCSDIVLMRKRALLLLMTQKLLL